MSTEIIKSVTFDEKRRRITTRAASSNVSPRTYDLWCPTDHGYEYDEWKRMLANSLAGGMARFLPSCTSKAHKAFKLVNRSFGMSIRESPWSYAERMYPYDVDPETGCCTFKYCDEELKEKHDALIEEWKHAFLVVLDELLAPKVKADPQGRLF